MPVTGGRVGVWVEGAPQQPEGLCLHVKTRLSRICRQQRCLQPAHRGVGRHAPPGQLQKNVCGAQTHARQVCATLAACWCPLVPLDATTTNPDRAIAARARYPNKLLPTLRLSGGSKGTLLTKLMKMDPKQRITARAALDATYFQEPPMYTSK